MSDEGAQDPSAAADGSGAVVVAADVPAAEGAFGGGVEFDNGVDAEAFFEFIPDIRAQTVAKGGADAMSLVEGVAGRVELRGSCDEVSQSFADVLDDAGVGGADFGPEGARGEFAAEGLGAAGLDGGDEGEEGCGGVVEWHALISEYELM